MASLAANIAELNDHNNALPVDIQNAVIEILRAAEAAGHHVTAVSWYNPASTPEHHVPGFKNQGGVANDFMIYGDVDTQDFVDNYSWRHRDRLGICWQISRRRIRSTSPGHSGAWGKYGGSNPHTDHTHINFGKLAGNSGYGKVENLTYKPLGEYVPDSPFVYVDRLRKGVNNSDSVYWLQKALVKLLVNTGLTPSGDFGDKTFAAVKRAQGADVLKNDPQYVDGELGIEQTKALFKLAGMDNPILESSN